MEKINVGHFVDVQAFKYDGTLYRQWNGVKVFLDSHNFVCAILNKTKVIEKSGQKWSIKEPTLWFFSKTDFYNVTVLPRKDGLYYYINLASPFFHEDNAIKYIDFDFDIKIYPGKAFSIVDHLDFQKNKEKLYSDDLVATIYKNLAKISKLVQEKDTIFDENYINSILKSLIDMNEISKKHLDFIK